MTGWPCLRGRDRADRLPGDLRPAGGDHHRSWPIRSSHDRPDARRDPGWARASHFLLGADELGRDNTRAHLLRRPDLAARRGGKPRGLAVAGGAVLGCCRHMGRPRGPTLARHRRCAGMPYLVFAHSLVDGAGAAQADHARRGRDRLLFHRRVARVRARPGPVYKGKEYIEAARSLVPAPCASMCVTSSQCRG